MVLTQEMSGTLGPDYHNAVLMLFYLKYLCAKIFQEMAVEVVDTVYLLFICFPIFSLLYM